MDKQQVIDAIIEVANSDSQYMPATIEDVKVYLESFIEEVLEYLGDGND